MIEHAVVVAIVAIIGVAALLTIIRIVRGPSVLDRAIATEVLVAILIVAFGLEAAIDRDTTTLPAIISLSLVSFTGSVAIALFVARDRDDETPGQLSRPGHHGVGPSGLEHDPEPGIPDGAVFEHTDDTHADHPRPRTEEGR